MNITGIIPMALISQALSVGEIIHLPQAQVKGELTLEESIAKRRSTRSFDSKPLSVDQIGQLLWSAQGITEKRNGLRSTPSAGALYPLETYVVMPTGIFHYDPGRHELKRVVEGDRRHELQKSALEQEAVSTAPAVFVFAVVYERTAAKYGDRAYRYGHIEAGHACQNLLLQATALGLVSVPVGAFDDSRVSEVVNLPKNQSPLYLAPVGYPDK